MKTLQGRVIPDTVDEALAAWDAGEQVQTVMMGNGSFENEIVIQTAMFELLRLFNGLDLVNEDGVVTATLADLVKVLNPTERQRQQVTQAIELELLATDAKVREVYGVPLDGEQGGKAAGLAIQIWREGYDTVRTIATTRLGFIGNPQAVKENRAERRATEAQARRTLQ